MASPDKKSLQVTAVVSFYMVSALVMVFVNKAVLNNAPDLPLLFLLLQLLIAVGLLHVSAALFKQIELPQFDKDVAKKLVPVVLVNIIGLVFNTLCLRGLEASFFQIARGLVLPLTILVSSIHTRSSPSRMVVFSAMVVTAGFLLGIAPSKSIPLHLVPSTISLFYGVLSSVFIAFHAVLIKISLPYCNNSSIKLAWWTNVGSAAFLFPLIILSGEHSTFQTMLHEKIWDWRIFIWGSVVTGFFGFLLCIAGLLSIKVTSPVTHMFSSAARSVLQTMLGVWIFNDLLTINRAASIMVILIGTMLYTWFKSATASPPLTREKDLESNNLDKPNDTTQNEKA